MRFRRGHFGRQLFLGEDRLGRVARYWLWWDGLRLVLLFHVIVTLYHLRLIGERRQRLIDIPFVVTELLSPVASLECALYTHPGLNAPALCPF